jgi:hypothetical protein
LLRSSRPGIRWPITGAPRRHRVAHLRRVIVRAAARLPLAVRVSVGDAFAGFTGCVRIGTVSWSSSSRIRGGSFPPPLPSAAALRAEITFAGGLCGRDRLGTISGSVPDTVKVRSFVPRGFATRSLVQT